MNKYICKNCKALIETETTTSKVGVCPICGNDELEIQNLSLTVNLVVESEVYADDSIDTFEFVKDGVKNELENKKRVIAKDSKVSITVEFETVEKK